LFWEYSTVDELRSHIDRHFIEAVNQIAETTTVAETTTAPTTVADDAGELHSALDAIVRETSIRWDGVPLAMVLTAANVHDSKVFEKLVDAVGPVKRPGKGRPRRRPEKLHADKAYDFRRCRAVLRRRGIKSRIARRGKDASERLGRYRWVVERKLAWLAQHRRLLVRYERRADVHEAFLYLGCALSCLTLT
jgi:transposase